MKTSDNLQLKFNILFHIQYLTLSCLLKLNVGGQRCHFIKLIILFERVLCSKKHRLD